MSRSGRPLAFLLFVSLIMCRFPSRSFCQELSISERPRGFCTATQMQENPVVVSTKDEFVKAIKKGGLIYVNGMIDLSEGMLPSVGGVATRGLDNICAKNTDFSSYSMFVKAYTKECTKETDDKSSAFPKSSLGRDLWKCSRAYKSVIQHKLISNTTVIGLTENSGFRGGSLVLSGVSNVVLRNLVLEDGYDPFPHHEKNDGYNAEFDLVSIQNGSHDIWIDHCTLRDTLEISFVVDGDGYREKWQTYDGLIDMKGEGTSNIVVSYCVFENHDKVMLIGSNDKDWDGCHRRVSLHHNIFRNCGQRLPMVRQTKIHIYNNMYIGDDSAFYPNIYAEGIRNKALVISEENYFDKSISHSMAGSDNEMARGSVYTYGNSDNSAKKGSGDYYTLTKRPDFIDYSYTLDSAIDLSAYLEGSAGAGKCKVVVGK